MNTSNDLMARMQAMQQGGLGYPGPHGALPGALPPMIPPYMPPSAPVTIEQVDQLIAARLAALKPAGPDMSKLQGFIVHAETVFQRALSPEDYKAFTAYTQSGGPGFSDILNSKALDPVVQLLWETIKENKK